MKTLEQPQLAEATAENAIITICTHDGVFHADDVFAVATILMVVGPRYDPFTDKERVRIVRTRDKAVIAAADYVVDVGGIHDPDTDRYDHHQGAGHRAYGACVPYAAFGLVWDNLGDQAIRNTLSLAADRGVSGTRQTLDAALVQAIDANDTGHEKARPESLSVAVSEFNPRWDEDSSAQHFGRKFDDAVSFAQGILARAIRSAAATIAVEEELRDTLAKATHAHQGLETPGVLVLSRYVPWQRFVADEDSAAHIKFVVFPSIDGTWKASTVPQRTGSYGPRRHEFTADWWGLNGKELDAITGVPGGVFCHINGFILGHQTKEGAVALAELALSVAEGGNV